VPAFLKYTNKVVFLDEMQMVEIKPEKYEVLDIKSGRQLKAKVNTITWDLSEAEKSGHPHFMIKEMLEQPTVLEKTIATDKTELERAAKMIRAAKRVYVVACGTALHAGMYGSYLLAIKNNLMIQPISAGELPYFGRLLKKGDLVICVSQSGETADVLEAVRSAHKNGAKVLALVNVMGSSLMRLADSSILTKAGPEICVLSTKAYVSQQAMFVMISSYLLGKPAEGKKALSAIKQGVEKILEKKSLENIKKIAKKLAKVPNLYSLGRGINFPNAMEAALKIKEVSYIHAEGFAGGDLKHGPIALIEPGVPVLVFVADDGADKEIVSNAMEVKARGAIVIGISFENNQVFETYLPIGKNGLYSPIESIVYAQLLSYYIALEKRLDPDKPRNLAKSVTVK
jgi:glucosamine--fructose-6-phosphate aminotransferase (isomerizing)